LALVRALSQPAIYHFRNLGDPVDYRDAHIPK
jgi:hypothetical protein